MKNKRCRRMLAILLCVTLGMAHTVPAQNNMCNVSENTIGSVSDNTAEVKDDIAEPELEPETDIAPETCGDISEEDEITIGIGGADETGLGIGSVSGNNTEGGDEPAPEMKLETPVISKIKSVNYKTVEVRYKTVEGADGYEIYRSKKKGSGYKKAATVKKADQAAWQDKKCSTGIKYYYKIRAYKKTAGGKQYSDYSAWKLGVAVLPVPKLKKAKMIGGDTVELTWKKITGAQGYQVYRCETPDGKYKKISTVKGKNAVRTTIGGQENGKYYYYKIRAYRKVSAKNRYSSLSGAKSVFFNLYGNANETYADKAQRIFGKSYYVKYTSEAEAKAHMTTFAIQVWDLNKDRTGKVSKSVLITTHENIAETVKMIFKEIYESDEKFPIKTIGCYSWRGDASTSEHCCGLAIDINWEENYMIDNGVILSGKYWRPGEDPYSIPLDCELVTIMNKYGFTRGFWGERKDYMHFSYFGT